MKKLILFLAVSTLLLGCSAEESENEGSGQELTYPNRFHGTWKNNSLDLEATFERNRMILETRYNGVITRTEGTVRSDNGTTLFIVDYPNDEEMTLLLLGYDTPDDYSDDLLGITYVANGDFYVRNNFTRN